MGVEKWAFVISLPLIFAACMKWDYGDETEYDVTAPGLFILNEGNFQYGNATLSFYNPNTGEAFNEVFFRANGMKLGDVAQSMAMHDGRGWIVVNNSHVIFAIDPDTFKETGRIENLTSPRYIHFVNDEKAYVTQIWDNRIAVVNPRKYEISGYIAVPGMTMETGSTEQMAQIGKYVFCTCWSYQNRIIKIDTETDEVVDELHIGNQPKFMVKDKYERLWTITDGGYEGSVYGKETPALYCINSSTFQVEKKFDFKRDSEPVGLIVNGPADTLYWIDGGVWRMPVENERLPVTPFVASKDTRYFGLTINPESGDIYVADAVDYQQPGMIYRFNSVGELLQEFYAGVNPGAFCWKE